MLLNKSFSQVCWVLWVSSVHYLLIGLWEEHPADKNLLQL